jgi:hypothetical protein
MWNPHLDLRTGLINNPVLHMPLRMHQIPRGRGSRPRIPADALSLLTSTSKSHAMAVD